jgi:hypothetical protein
MIYSAVATLAHPTFHVSFQRKEDVVVSDSLPIQFLDHETIHHRRAHHYGGSFGGIEREGGDEGGDQTHLGIPGGSRWNRIHCIAAVEFPLASPGCQIFLVELIVGSLGPVKDSDATELLSSVLAVLDKGAKGSEAASTGDEQEIPPLHAGNIEAGAEGAANTDRIAWTKLVQSPCEGPYAPYTQL